MIAMAMLMGFALVLLLALLIFAAKIEGKQGPPPMQTKTLREIERSLLEIQNHSTDIYASGKASQAADKIRQVLDRD